MKLFAPLSTGLLLGAALGATPAVAQQKPANEAYYVATPRLEAVVFPAAEPLKIWMIAEKQDFRNGLLIELLDARGNQLYATKVGRLTNKVRQRFDLSEMPDGQYTFRISDGNTVQERVVRLSSPGLAEELPKRLVSMK